MKHSRPSARVVQAVAAAAVFTGVTALMCISLCSADDFWYSTFLDGGVAQFLELSRYHYEVFNGRVLVHLAAQVILHFGRWCFALFGLLCCLAIPLAALKAAQRPRGQVPACLALFGAGVLALPRALLVEGLLWTSAFCNYALPTAMIVGSSGQGKIHTACSSLHFKPVENVEWRMVFHEKQFGNATLDLIK